VAFELLALTQWWNDQGLGPYHLYYVRDKDGHESDFLIVFAQRPWLLIEAKLTDQGISAQHTRHADQLGKIPVLQVCQQPDIFRKDAEGYRLSAAAVFC
jgi:hypothetical protein